MRSVIRLTPTLALVAAAAVLTACGGSSSPPEVPSAQRPASIEEQGIEAERSAPPAAAVEPTPTPPPPYLLSAVTPTAGAEPPPGLDALLGVAPDDDAAAAMTEVLLAAGFSLAGFELFVFPLPEGQGNMLVFDIDIPLDLTGAEQSPFEDPALGSFDQDDAFASLVASDAYANADIGRFVFNLGLVTAEGSVVYIVTMPASVFEDLISGAITEEVAQAQIISETRWVDPQ